ncbi:hypothetical protein B0H14DRAFT_3580644 [Mycena olivaceomarginata]|nr:hypothetical protein B0H14DRAFT_3580644 [Mycena olivaceomarginata]
MVAVPDLGPYASLPLPGRNVSPDPSGVPFAKTLVLSPPLAAGARRRTLSDPLGNSETFQHYRQVAAHSPGYVMPPSGPKLTVSSAHTHADCHLQYSRPESCQEALKQSPSYSQCSYCAAVSKQLALLISLPPLTSSIKCRCAAPSAAPLRGPLTWYTHLRGRTNIPWTITPPAILSFLGVPSSPGARAHILLDRLGKTQSHAFVELPSSAVACAVVRGEHRATPKLGDGRRARDVTLTLSSPAALMAALFDSPFGRPAPFLTGGAPPGTHTCNSELMVLISLIRTPNPRFVKTPSLPFYLLTSMLSKIPADGDRHLLWTGSGILYDITIHCYSGAAFVLPRSVSSLDFLWCSFTYDFYWALVNRCKSGCPWTVWACTTTASYHLGDLAVALAIKLVTGGTCGAAFCSVRCVFIVGIGGYILLLFSARSADTCSPSAPSTASTTAPTTPPGLLPLFSSVLVDHPIQLTESTAFLYLFGTFFFLKSPSLLIRFFLLPFRFRHRLLLFLLPGLLPLLFQPLPCCEASCSALEPKCKECHPEVEKRLERRVRAFRWSDKKLIVVNKETHVMRHNSDMAQVVPDIGPSRPLWRFAADEYLAITLGLPQAKATIFRMPDRIAGDFITVKQFFKSKHNKERIQFQGNISIEKLIEDMATRDILTTLTYIPARYNAENTPNKCMEGTRVDIIKDIVARLTGRPDTSQRIVMLSGSAGSGKSTIAKTVASILAEDKHVLAASFFFSRNYADRREIGGLPSTIAHQLADHVWDAESGEQVGKPFEGLSGGVACVAFSPDGRHIVSGF